jgi:S1-C subfamily serine protease
MTDGRKVTARLIGTDPSTDVAVLQLETHTSLPTVPLGDSSKLRVGQVGNRPLIVTTLLYTAPSHFRHRNSGYGSSTDVAVLQLETHTSLPTVPLGDSSKLRVGQVRI